jgi:LytS/YehU family sensor histidine kinase
MLIYLTIIITQKIVTKNNAKRNLQLELELKSIYAQINPHFIFNSLNAALYLVKTNRLDDAHTHINKFSNLLRSYIKSSRNRFIKIREEITNLKNYIELQQTRFKDRFEYEIIVDPSLDTNVNIPSLLLQPLVENAIIHGLLHKEEKGKLKIEFKDNALENEVICIIDDNGVGRKLSRQIEENMSASKESYGGDLIKDLTGIFNKYMKMKITIEYIDKEGLETGTTVIIRVKDI